MSASTWGMIGIVAFALSGVLLIAAALIFFLLKIPDVIGDLSGKTVAREMERMRQSNASRGDRSFRTGRINRERGMLTDRVSDKQAKETPYAGKRVAANTAYRPDSSSQTDVLPYTEATDVLTSVEATERLSSAEATELLRETEATEVLQDSGATALLSDMGATEVLTDTEATEVLSPPEDGATEVLSSTECATEVLSSTECATEVLSSAGNATEVLSGTESVLPPDRSNATTVLTEENTAATDPGGKRAVRFRVTRSIEVTHAEREKDKRD